MNKVLDNLNHGTVSKLDGLDVDYNIIDWQFKLGDNGKYLKTYKITIMNRCPVVRGYLYLAKVRKIKGIFISTLSYLNDKATGELLATLGTDNVKTCQCGENTRNFHVYLDIDNVNQVYVLKCRHCSKFNPTGSEKNQVDEILQSNDEWLRYNRYDIKTYVAYLIRECETSSFLVDKENPQNSSSNKAYSAMTSGLNIEDRYYTKAEDYINCILEKNQDTSNLNDFMVLLILTIKKNIITKNDINVASFIFKIGKELLEKQVSEHVGTVGESLKGEVIFTKRNQCYTKYGLCNFYEMVYNGNNILSYATNKYLDLKLGETYNIDCVIKKHTVFNDVKITNISNCKFKKNEVVS